MQARRLGKLVGTAMTIALAVGLPLLASPASAAPNPPGNNGTIKVDGQPFDDAPDNEPHVGCTFQVDFYGYDQGDLFADVTFEAHPPTGPVQTLLTDTVFIGEDDNSGGGSEAGLDASATYTLDFDAIVPHPVQGFHVKLTIHADGSQGADTKHKVFWVTGCEQQTTTTTTPGGSSSTSGVSSSSTTTTTRGSKQTTSTTAVHGATSTAPSSSSGAASSSRGGGALPFTGARGVAPLLYAGLLLTALGVASLLAIRRRT
jgi:hypothetical protein